MDIVLLYCYGTVCVKKSAQKIYTAKNDGELNQQPFWDEERSLAVQQTARLKSIELIERRIQEQAQNITTRRRSGGSCGWEFSGSKGSPYK